MNATVTDVKPKTTEQVRADKRQRVILKSTQKLAKKAHLSQQSRIVPTKRTVPKVSPRLQVTPSTQALARKLPTAVAEPTLSSAAMRSLAHAVACMERPDKSLNQRRLMAHYHLRQHSALSNLNPDDLIFEQSTPNSCSSQSRLAPSSDGTRVGL